MRSIVFAVLLAALSGCGSYPKPEAHVATSEGSIRGAQEAGAASVPQAALHLKLAQEERERALALVKEGENERAEYMFMRSEADAELANALAREAAANKEAQTAEEKLDATKKKASQ